MQRTGNHAPEPEPSAIETPTEPAQDDPDYEQAEIGVQTSRGRKKRSRKPGASNKNKDGGSGRSQPSLDSFTRRPNVDTVNGGTTANAQNVSAGLSLEVDPNRDRRKRRKTRSPRPSLDEATDSDIAQAPEAMDWHQQLQIEAEKGANENDSASALRATEDTMNQPIHQAEDLAHSRTPSRVNEPESANAPASTDRAFKSAQKNTPKKLLKVNKNGKLLSSPPAKPEPETNSPKKRRGRKASKNKAPPTVTIIKYGSDDASRFAIGRKIEDILSGSKPALRPIPPKKVPPKPAEPPKPTHPFFLGKPAQKQVEARPAKPTSETRSSPSPRALKKSAVTPGKLRAESRSYQSPVSMPVFGAVPGSNRTPKHAGMGEAPWPSKETAHVRNLDSDSSVASLTPTSQRHLLKIRKMKNRIPTIPQDEDLMSRLAQQLRPSIHLKNVLAESDFEPPKDVRLPTRSLATGINIQEQVRSQVQAQLPHGSEQDSGEAATHPAIRELFSEIEHTLTPFDLGRCEIHSWAQKYAPKSASHVLQAGEEAMVLHDWLKSLTVMAVEGKHKGSKSGSAMEVKRPPKKKRKKDEDDFIVDSDEDVDEDMIELSDLGGCENIIQCSASMRSLRRPQWSRNKNVVLISGPHGCGKSATVYAVAKELGFEVFEINSGSRRSGRDIQDKVGDMTANHLVNHRRDETTATQDAAQTDDTDNERMSNALRRDLESGRQGTMTSFFKTNGTANSKPKAKAKAQEPKKAITSAQAALSIAQPQRKSQKQSLILFEEADILFEEDQQFWAQVTKLAAQSKRPIVITCNNETLIPVNELPLGAIFRLSPPPLDLATDYMLVLAGREGHVLRRDAVSNLYMSKDHDLRASITELNLWCQMAVGDRKGGLEWIYQRWPPGKDVDEHGRLLRIASRGTYQPGMGWLSHNTFSASGNACFDKEQELLKETWVDWGIDPCEWNDHRERTQSPMDVSQDVHSSSLEDLERLEAVSDSISAADIYCRVDMPFYERYYEPTDPCLPSMPDKERLNYTLAAPVIQTDHFLDFTDFDRNIFIQSHLLIQRTYGGREASVTESKRNIPATEEGFTRAILQHKEAQQRKHSLSRPNFSEAFDPLAYLPDTVPAMNSSYNLTASSFDRTFRIVVEDLGPYVRSIVAHELVLEAQRIRLGNLLSEGGRGKRQRTTRAARVALEGGKRETKRRERWFGKHLNRTLVMATAGRNWTGMGSGAEEAEMSSRTGESLSGAQEE